jgi:hypothetical protein
LHLPRFLFVLVVFVLVVVVFVVVVPDIFVVIEVVVLDLRGGIRVLPLHRTPLFSTGKTTYLAAAGLAASGFAWDG